MTAIAAIFHRDGSPVAREDMERMARSLAHYGAERQRVGLYGEAGLACALDSYTPEDIGQSQPIIGGEGRLAMVFEGRIDNRGEVVEMLGLDPMDASRMSDGVLAMRSFERWGVGSFLKWIADFALILWDEAERHILLARDPFGHRGIVYHDAGDRFVAATVAAGLHALPDIPRELDEQKLGDALSQFFADNTRTFFKGVSLCPPGHFMVVDRNGARSQQYYRLRDHVREVRYKNDDDYVEAARELFQKAVSARLRSTGPVGAFMSGGLDSSTGAIFAAEQLAKKGQRLPVFTSVPEAGWDGLVEAHCYGDETPYVKAIAERHPNIELNLVDSAGRSHYFQQDAALRLSEMPMRNACNGHWWHSIMQEARSRKIKVMLGGDAGNMTLSYRGDGIYYDLWRSRRFIQLYRELGFLGRRPRQMARNFYGRVLPGLMSDSAWDAMQRLLGNQDLESRWLRHSCIRPEFGQALDIPTRAHASGFNYFGRARAANRQWCYWFFEQAAGSFSQANAGTGALYNIELRDPFGDRRLLEWCFGVPEDQYHRNGVGRWLIRRMMKGVMPDEVLHKRRDVGRQSSDWHLRMTRDLDRMKADLERMSQDPDLARMMDIPRLQSMLEDWPDRTVVDASDYRRSYLLVNVPMALQIGRFVQIVKGSNA